jgi:hypothetical protein
MNSNRNQVNDGEAKAKSEVIKLGLDLHARQVTECRQLNALSSGLSSTGIAKPNKSLLKWLEERRQSLTRLRGFEGYINRKSFKINTSA